MDNKVEVLGIRIDGCHISEIIEKMEADWNNAGFFTYGIITMNLLMAAKEDPEMIKFIDSLDISIIGENEVLEAAGIEDEQMRREVSEQAFFTTAVNLAVKHKRAVFLLGESREETEAFKVYLEERYQGIMITGCDYLHMDEADCIDKVINEINSVSPEMVMTCAKGLGLEKFAIENRKKINAKIWLSLGNHFGRKSDMRVKSRWLGKLLEKKTFRKMVLKYNSKKGE